MYPWSKPSLESLEAIVSFIPDTPGARATRISTLQAFQVLDDGLEIVPLFCAVQAARAQNDQPGMYVRVSRVSVFRTNATEVACTPGPEGTKSPFRKVQAQNPESL